MYQYKQQTVQSYFSTFITGRVSQSQSEDVSPLLDTDDDATHINPITSQKHQHQQQQQQQQPSVTPTQLHRPPQSTSSSQPQQQPMSTPIKNKGHPTQVAAPMLSSPQRPPADTSSVGLAAKFCRRLVPLPVYRRYRRHQSNCD